MKIRCTTCGAPNETASGFDTAFCLTCGNQIPVSDALEYRLQRSVSDYLAPDALADLAREAHLARKITADNLWLLHIAAPNGDVEINYLLGQHYFNERDYARAIPYLYVAAEKMYPDEQCLYAVAKYLQNPDDAAAYPRIRKFLRTAQETCSKVYQKIDGDKLLDYMDSVLSTQTTPQDLPDISPFSEISDIG